MSEDESRVKKLEEDGVCRRWKQHKGQLKMKAAQRSKENGSSTMFLGLCTLQALSLSAIFLVLAKKNFFSVVSFLGSCLDGDDVLYDMGANMYLQPPLLEGLGGPYMASESLRRAQKG